MEDDFELSVLIPPASENHVKADRTFNSAQALLKAVLDNNVEELNTVLLKASPEVFNQNYPQCDFKNIITIACKEPEVSEHVLETLLQYVIRKIPNLDLMEERWYFWEPIHFAAYNVDVGKLKVFLRNIPSNRVNSLTVFSENALHVLMEYGKCIESFNVQLSNGWEGRNCHVMAQEHPELVQCTKELVESGIDINHPNLWSETPLIIAIRYRLMGAIELLLKRRDIDLDTTRDPYTGKSARELLRENEICINLLGLTTSLGVTPKKTLFLYLKSGDEGRFLRYNNENIKRYANRLDGDNEYNTSGTMLQLCLLKGYIDFKKEEHGVPQDERDIMKTCMLKVFCKKGFARSIEHLLNNGAEVTKSHRLFKNLNIFELAVKFAYYPFLAIVLQHKSNQIDARRIILVLKNTLEPCMDINHNIKHVLYVLMWKLESLHASVGLKAVAYNYEDRRVFNTILDMYLQHNADKDYDENICQVLRLGASLIDKTECLTRLQSITYETLSEHLDNCVDSSNNVCYNSFILDDEEKYSETKVLRYLVHHPKKNDLLNHPTLIYLIHAKWLKTKKFFYWNVAFYAVFLLSLYSYMICLELDRMQPVLYYLFVTLLGIQSVKELVQMIMYHHRYFSDISNYMEAVLMICCYINIVFKEERAMIVAILLSTLDFLLMLGQLPKFTKYMIVFGSTKYFFEYAGFYFLQFFSFALCFFILLPADEESQRAPLGEIFGKLFDSLMYFIGQYDGPVVEPPNFPVFGRIIVAIFAFCMTIILNNLLVGLIVTDMDVIQKTSKLLRQVKIVKYIEKIETFLERVKRWCCFGIKRGSTNIFQAKSHKMMYLSDTHIFDDEDKAWLKRIHEMRKPKRNILQELYEHIMNEVYSDDTSMTYLKGNKAILYKLSKLEEQLAKMRP